MTVEIALAVVFFSLLVLILCLAVVGTVRAGNLQEDIESVSLARMSTEKKYADALTYVFDRIVKFDRELEKIDKKIQEGDEVSATLVGAVRDEIEEMGDLLHSLVLSTAEVSRKVGEMYTPDS